MHENVGRHLYKKTFVTNQNLRKDTNNYVIKTANLNCKTQHESIQWKKQKQKKQSRL